MQHPLMADRRSPRLLTLALFLLLALFVAGCGGDDDNDSGDSNTTASEAESSDDDASKDESEEDEGGSDDAESEETDGAEGGDDAGEGGADGKNVFSNNCGVCHGAQGTGGNGGPPVTTATDVAANVTQIAKGGGGMPAFEGQLSDEEIQAVAEYVAEELAQG